MSEETTDKASKAWLYGLSLVLALPLLYALSIGPAVVLLMRGWASNSAVNTLYKPLQSFADATNTEVLFRSYIEAWMITTGTTLHFPK
ncbi:MAG: hypothetical protein ACKODH_08015 [Limisphaerales bacterium]